MKKLIIALLLGFVFMSGCDVIRTEYVYHRSFATGFFETGGVKLEIFGNTLYVGIEWKYPFYCHDYVGTNKERYEELCQKYGDMTYDRMVPLYAGFEREHMFQASSFVSLKIESDADYNAEHPAGTPLNDIVVYDGQSSKPFIDSGYQLYYWEDVDKFYYHNDKHERPYYPVYKKASEVTAYDLMLIYHTEHSSSMCLRFETPPTSARSHNITVTFTDERGKTFSDTILMEF